MTTRLFPYVTLGVQRRMRRLPSAITIQSWFEKGQWATRLLATALVLLMAAPASAGVGEEAAKLLASDSLDETRRGIEILAGSGHPRALTVLEGLEAGVVGLDANRQLVVHSEAGNVFALTGEPAPGSFEKLRLNNVVRRTLSATLAAMRLSSDELAVRRVAVEAVAKRPEPELYQQLTAALKKETDDDLRSLLRLAVAQLDIAGPERNKQLAAIAVLEESGSVEHKPLLQPFVTRDKSGSYVESDKDLRHAARGALGSIERRATLMSAVANLFFGLSLGSVLLLAALGLAITFGLMKVINMAHGEMIMLGAYTTFVVQQALAAWMPAQMELYLVVAVPLAFFASGAVGFLLERLVVRHLYGRPLETLLATWGASLILIQLIRAKFGAANVTVANPEWLSGGLELLPSVVLPYSRIAIIAFTVVVVYFVWFMLRRTNLGLYVRAVTQNRDMAANVGIPTQKIDTWTFALGCGVAGLGGVALSQLGNVGPELGQGYIVDSFMVVVLGGVGNIFGTILGALGLGLINKFLEPIAGAVLGKIFVLVMIILFIQKRPQGIFALKGRAAEL